MGMTQVFATDGTMYPVTVIEVLPNVVTQKKTIEKDGYEPKYELRELKGDEMAKYNVGDSITVDIFQAGDVIDVTGTSKGKGFSGAIKRYGYTIGPKGHGSGYHRGSGSYATIGRTNNRIHPGKKSAGHHGNKTATILNLVVVAVDASKNALLVKGAIPGPTKSIVTVRSAVKAQKSAKVIKTLVNNTTAAAE